MSKTPTSFKLSPTAHEILAELSTRRGQSKVAILERNLREEIARENDSPILTVRKVRYLDFEGRAIIAEHKSSPIPHAVFSEAISGRKLTSPIMSTSTWAGFVTGLMADPSTMAHEVK